MTYSQVIIHAVTDSKWHFIQAFFAKMCN